MKTPAAALLASTLIALGSAAWAAPSAIMATKCGYLEFGVNGTPYAMCRLHNAGTEPVATVEAVVLLKSPKGRAVTRSETSFEVPGGIEPGATEWIAVPHPLSAAEFANTPFVTEVQVLDARAYDDSRVHLVGQGETSLEASTQVAPSPKQGRGDEARDGAAVIAGLPRHLRPDEAQELAREIKDCWQVNPRSEISAIDLDVTFDLDEDAQIEGEVEVLRATDYNEKVVWDAYMVVRRAILKCQGDGFSVQGPVEDIKMQFTNGVTAQVIG